MLMLELDFAPLPLFVLMRFGTTSMLVRAYFYAYICAYIYAYICPYVFTYICAYIYAYVYA